MAGARRGKHIGTGLLRRGDQRVGAETEHAGVPRVIARQQVAFRRGLIGLFNEGSNFSAFAPFNRSAHADIAKPGFRPTRLDAKGDQPAIGGNLLGPAHIGRKSLDVTDQMIRWQNQQSCIGAALIEHMQGSEYNCRRGIAPDRFEQERQAIEIGIRVAGILIAGQEIVVATGHRQHGAAIGELERAIESLVEQRLAITHAHERLGIGTARDWPEPGAGAAGKDHRNDHDVSPCSEVAASSPITSRSPSVQGRGCCPNTRASLELSSTENAGRCARVG